MTLHFNKHESLSPKSWSSGSREEDFFNLNNVFLLIRNYRPLEKGVTIHLNKFEFSSPENALCKVRLKLALWFWRWLFLNIVSVFSLFRNYLPLEKGVALHLSNLNPRHPRMLCAKFSWNWPSGSGEVNDNIESLQAIRKALLSWKLRWAIKKRVNQQIQ